MTEPNFDPKAGPRSFDPPRPLADLPRALEALAADPGGGGPMGVFRGEGGDLARVLEAEGGRSADGRDAVQKINLLIDGYHHALGEAGAREVEVSEASAPSPLDPEGGVVTVKAEAAFPLGGRTCLVGVKAGKEGSRLTFGPGGMASQIRGLSALRGAAPEKYFVAFGFWEDERGELEIGQDVTRMLAGRGVPWFAVVGPEAKDNQSYITARTQPKGMANKYTTVSIPTTLHLRLQKLIAERTGFKSVSDYVTYVLREVVAMHETKETPEPFTSQDVDEIKARLQALGYL